MLPCGNNKQLLLDNPVQLDLPKHRIQQWCDSLCYFHPLRIQSLQYDPHPLGGQRSVGGYGYVFEAAITHCMLVHFLARSSLYLLLHRTWKAWLTFLDWIEWCGFLSQIRSVQVLYHQAFIRRKDVVYWWVSVLCPRGLTFPNLNRNVFELTS